MKPKSLRFVILFSYCLLLTPYSLLSSAVPQQMSYQGKVTSTDGVGITDTLDIAFSLWNSAVDGDSVWGETQTDVPIIKGLFDAQLGSVNPIALSFDTTYWLQIIVDGDLLLPRAQLTTSPYAFRASFADSLAGGIALTDSDWTISGDNMYSARLGNVGIGTLNPWYKLHVVSDSIAAILANCADNHGIHGISSGISTAGVLGETASPSSWGVYGFDSYGGISAKR